MKRYRKQTTILLAAIIALHSAACDQRDEPAALIPVETITQMGDATMLTIGDDWIYRFSRDGEPCAIVGDDVALIGNTPEHLVVDLHGGVEANVPISGLHPVLLVSISGITNVNIKISDFEDDKGLLEAVLEFDAKRAEQVVVE